jgi:hypothetical protein
MKLGKVKVTMDIVVDMDDPEMVTDAKRMLYEELMNSYKYDELFDWIDVEEAPDASENDIPECLTEEF